MCCYTRASRTLRCCFMAGCKSYQRAGSERTLPGYHKRKVIDERIGEYEDVNEAVRKLSQGALDDVSLYSIMEEPMTSCGCFECICGIEPFSNGVCIANREYAGMTPLGMTFSELASMTGGGVQTPGFMGHGKHFIASKKFMKAEGGSRVSYGCRKS